MVAILTILMMNCFVMRLSNGGNGIRPNCKEVFL